MSIKTDIDAKYAKPKTDTSKISVVSSPYEPVFSGSKKEQIDQKYSNTSTKPKSTAPVITQVTNMPETLNANTPIDVPDRPQQTFISEEPTGIVNSLKRFFGFKVEPKTAMVFGLDEDTKNKIVNQAALSNYNVRQLQRAIASDKTVEDVKLDGNTAYEYTRLGDRFLASVANTVIPKSLQSLAAAPGSVIDQSLSGALDPENIAEQVASYSGTALGNALMFSVAQPLVATQLSKVPAFVRLAQNYPKIANIIAGGVSFSGAGAISNAIQEKSAGEIIKDIPGDFVTGAGFGIGDTVKLAVPAVFGTSFLGSKLKGESNSAAFTSAVLNSVFAGGQKYLEAGDTGKLVDVATENAFKKLGVSRTATPEQIKAAYRKLAHETHPDRGGNANDFVEINAAYQVAKAAPAERPGLIQEFKNLYDDLRAGKSPFRGTEAPAGQAAPTEGPTKAITTTTPEASITPAAPASQAVAPVVQQITPQTLPDPEVQRLAKQPLDEAVIERIRKLNPENQITFGREIENTLRETLSAPVGQDLSEAKVTFSDKPLASGAPARFTPEGKIEVSLPQIAQDLKILIGGGRIAAHPNSPFATVYKKKDGESIQQLASRYITDVLVHEQAHLRTITGDDRAFGDQLMGQLDQAIASNNTKLITETRTLIDKYGQALEDKANSFLQTNKEALLKEIAPQIEVVTANYAKAAEAEKQTLLSSISQKFQKAFKKGVQKGKAVLERKQIREKVIERKDKQIAKIKEKNAEKIETLKQDLDLKKKVAIKKETDALKMRVREIVKKIEDQANTVEGRRSELYNYAKLIPASVRGKFLGAIKNTTSQKDFFDVLDRMAKATQAVERKGLIQEIYKELKTIKAKKQEGILKGKFTAEVQARLDSIRTNLKNDYALARIRRNDLIAEFREANGDAPLPAEILTKLENLAMQGIGDMDTKELRFTLNNIQSLKENGRTANEIAKFNRETRITTIKDKINEIITGGKPLPSDLIGMASDDKVKFSEHVKDFFTYQQYGWEELLDSLSFYDKGSKPYESFLNRFGNKAHQSNVREFTNQQAEILKGDAAIRKIYGLETNGQVMRYINELNQPVDLGKQLYADGVARETKISPGQAMYFYALMQNPNLAETLEVGMKWTPQIMEKVKNILTAQDKKMVEWLMQDLQDYYPSINEVYAKENFVNLPFDDKYFPIYRNVEKIKEKESTAGSVASLLSEESRYYATVKNGSLKTRSNNAVPIEFKNIFDVWYTHKIKMEHYKAWADTMYDFRRVFGDPEIKQAITDFHGKGANTVIARFLDDMARGGVDGRNVYQALELFRRNVTTSILGANYKVGIKQLSGILNFMLELPAKDFFSGVAKFFASPIKNKDFLKKGSGALAERFSEGYERDVRYAMQQGYGEKLLKAKNIQEYLFTAIRFADELTVLPGAFASYESKLKELRAEGITGKQAEDQAMEYAERIVNRVQESSQLDTLSHIQRGGSFFKIFTMFQSQPSKFWRIMANSMRNLKAGRGNRLTHLKRIVMVGWLLPILYQMIENKTQGKDATDLNPWQIAAGPFQYPLIFGQVVQSAVGWAAGSTFRYQASPVLSTVDDLQKAIGKFSPNDMIESISYFIDLMGKLGGVPTKPLTSPIRKKIKDEKSGAVNKNSTAAF